MAAPEDPEVTPDNQPDEQPKSTDDLLREILAQQQQQRQEHAQEVAELRKEIADAKRAPTPAPAVALSEDELREQRANEIADHEFYCPGCGALYDYPQKCEGRGEAPHPAIEVVSTDELKGDDTSAHTAAPGVNP